MNELFVNVKVDREERPDIDQIYQAAQQMLTQRTGGWPLTMFLTPDQVPVLRRHLLPEGGALRPARVRRPHAARARLLRRASAATSRRRTASSWPPSRARSRAAGRTPPSSPTRRCARRSPSTRARSTARAAASARRPSSRTPTRSRRCLRHYAATGDARAARDGDDDAREDGRGRHLRPAGRRLRALQRGRRVGHPALREDALRQRPAPPPLRRRLGDHRRAALRAHGRGDGRLGDARDAVARGRLLLLARRGFRGRGGQVLRLVARGGARAPHRRRRRPSRSRTTASTARPTSRATRGTRSSPRRSATSPPRSGIARGRGGRAPRLGAARSSSRRASGACAPAATTRSSPPGTRS